MHGDDGGGGSGLCYTAGQADTGTAAITVGQTESQATKVRENTNVLLNLAAADISAAAGDHH
jgi:hypothetical protein